tara:strand:- start:371 stop:1099 length:729 start_codon:yes stop_codon:yes gene_type:complete
MPGITHSNIPLSANVFVNGGPTLGGAVADALGLPDTIGIDDAAARAIISGRAAELARGNNPNINEALEQYAGGQEGGTSPVTGQEGSMPAPGSDAAVDGDATVDSTIAVPVSDWITVKKDVNPRVLPEVWTKAENFAKSMGRPILMTSGARTPEFNKSIGGAGESVHTKRQAMDIAWGTTSIQGRVDMIQRAIDAGFTGIGCYEWGMHMDISTKRNWGPSGSYTSQYAQYKPVLKANGFYVG